MTGPQYIESHAIIKSIRCGAQVFNRNAFPVVRRIDLQIGIGAVGTNRQRQTRGGIPEQAGRLRILFGQLKTVVELLVSDRHAFIETMFRKQFAGRDQLRIEFKHTGCAETKLAGIDGWSEVEIRMPAIGNRDQRVAFIGHDGLYIQYMIYPECIGDMAGVVKRVGGIIFLIKK